MSDGYGSQAPPMYRLVPAIFLSSLGAVLFSLLIFRLLAAVLGLVAASWPARRAARLDVLAAIATE